MSKKYVSKKDRIIRYLNLLEFYKDKKEGVDYILWYRPKHGWIIRHVVMEETKGKYIEIILYQPLRIIFLGRILLRLRGTRRRRFLRGEFLVEIESY